MSRLWDKGAPLDERVLAYTAGEDYALDERLVAYDVRASIAHAEMLQRAEAAVAMRTCRRSATGSQAHRRTSTRAASGTSSSRTRTARRRSRSG